MGRLYENMTAAEIVSHVMAHGLSTAQEDICDVQDSFGHTAVEELERLANDIGRVNEDGEPDPNGAYSNGRRGTRGAFYMILFTIWNWEDATRFWNLVTNPDRDRLEKLTEDNKVLTRQLKAERDALAGARSSQEFWEKEAFKAQDIAAESRDKLRKAEREIFKLKAKLYDLIVKEDEE